MNQYTWKDVNPNDDLDTDYEDHVWEGLRKYKNTTVEDDTISYDDEINDLTYFSDDHPFNIHEQKQFVYSIDIDDEQYNNPLSQKIRADDLELQESAQDIVNGTDGDDILIGNEHQNLIRGGQGNDILISGTGNETLEGGDGNDTYIFGKNFGEDSIYNHDQTPNRKDVIQFKAGWTAQDFDYFRSQDDLIIQSKTTSDQIYVDYHFDQAFQINEIQFEDGTVFNVDDIKHLAQVVDAPSHDEFVVAGHLQSMKNAMASTSTEGSVAQMLNTNQNMTGSPHLLISDQ